MPGDELTNAIRPADTSLLGCCGGAKSLNFVSWSTSPSSLAFSFLVASGFCFLDGGRKSPNFFLGFTSLLPPFSRLRRGFWRSLGGGKSSKSSSGGCSKVEIFYNLSQVILFH